MTILAAPQRGSRDSLVRGFIFSAFLFLSLPRVRGEGDITYKYEGYRESGGRVNVYTRSALLEQDLGANFRVKLEGIIDAIAGATPTGEPAPAGSDQVVLSSLHDRRKAWTSEFSRQFSRVNLAVGVANSRESDYVSTGWSLNTVTDFNQKNTTLLAGVAGTDDDVKVFFQTPYVKKKGNDFIVGVTQLLDPSTSVTLNVTYGRAYGYLSDPYKLVQKSIQVLPGLFLTQTFRENRPNERKKWIALAGINRSFESLRGAVDATYRFYHDDSGTSAHTVEVAWFQHLGEKFILRPGVRFYTQSAADYYYYNLDNIAALVPSRNPSPNGPFYSSDFRVSSFRTATYGIKAIWTINDRLQLDAAIESYRMDGRDGVTPRSAYTTATIKTVGAKFSW